MKRIAIIGGGISGLTAAYELELARKRGASLDWHLYEASDRLGGIIETTRHQRAEGEYILESGPDGWVSEKPWARDLAIELGLKNELIYSNDATRRTYILRDNELQPIPDHMRMMVPENSDALTALDNSPLFSASAKQAYAEELTRAEELRASAPNQDESVASFVRRHFGDEVLNTLAAPLLSGVFGGDVHKLSVRAVMPQFVAMEREQGSLIAALQTKAKQRSHEPQPLFTSLRRGMASLVEALVATLPSSRLHLKTPAKDIGDENRRHVVIDKQGQLIADRFDDIVLATSLDASRDLLRLAGDHRLREPLPTDASSAVLACFTWTAELAGSFTIPDGFGFLVPHTSSSEPSLLACTFVDQKFPHRAPEGSRILRAFFGGASAEALQSTPDDAIPAEALKQLRSILGPIPEPSFSTIRRWPRSLPQYEVGHLERMGQLDELVARIGNLHLLGNSYRGVGIPDLIRDARAISRAIAGSLSEA